MLVCRATVAGQHTHDAEPTPSASSANHLVGACASSNTCKRKQWHCEQPLGTARPAVFFWLIVRRWQSCHCCLPMLLAIAEHSALCTPVPHITGREGGQVPTQLTSAAYADSPTTSSQRSPSTLTSVASNASLMKRPHAATKINAWLWSAVVNPSWSWRYWNSMSCVTETGRAIHRRCDSAHMYGLCMTLTVCGPRKMHTVF